MSRGDTVQVRGRDGMSTPQNSAAAYSDSRISPWQICDTIFTTLVFHCLPCSFRLHECPPSMIGPSNCRGFPLTSLSFASSHLLMQTLRVRLTRHYRVTLTVNALFRFRFLCGFCTFSVCFNWCHFYLMLFTFVVLGLVSSLLSQEIG